MVNRTFTAPFQTFRLLQVLFVMETPSIHGTAEKTITSILTGLHSIMYKPNTPAPVPKTSAGLVKSFIYTTLITD
jgi:hypothetical protein